MQCFAAWVCSCDGLCRTQIPRNSLFKLHAWYSWYSTATRLDLHLECYLCRTSLELNASREPEPGPSCMQAGPALKNFAGEHFSLLTSRPCVFNLLVVLRFGFRHDRRHAHILTLQGFDHHFSGSVHQFFFLVLAVSKVLWLHWVLAQVLDMLKVCNPFVHKLSWPSTWDWQHFGNHLSCPCATCALNLAWFDCHCYRRGMNRYRSPRVLGRNMSKPSPKPLSCHMSKSTIYIYNIIYEYIANQLSIHNL